MYNNNYMVVCYYNNYNDYMYVCTYILIMIMLLYAFVYVYLYIAGMNYITTASVLNVTIPAGEVSTSFVIEIIENVIQEDTETFNIAITMIQNCSSLSLDISSSTISIIDNNGMVSIYIIYMACVVIKLF